ncbi:calcium-binding protein [Inquilinus limosus]|uniref:calcium-binding protein n=1 Tax=Inquilinus limosus TaxID=171674 RepID=UPI000690FEB6|nr:calcium-binding protein [Inquilinus limosus]
MATFTGSNGAEILPNLILGPVQAIGNDFVDALGGDDVAIGWSGDDVIRGGAGGDVIIGGLLNAAGVITLSGIDAADYTTSVDGVTIDLSVLVSLTLPILGINIQLTGASQGFGGDAQNDFLVGIVNLIGSNTGGDNLSGSAAANTINGQGGDDALDGQGGNDILLGGAGDDILVGGGGADSLQGGAGVNDTADYSGSAAPVTVSLATGVGTGGDAEGDTLSGIERVIGSAGNDTLTGSGFSNDTLIGGAGADILDGQGGIDTADYSGSGAGVTVDLAAGTGSGGDAEGDTLTGIENITGTAFIDHLYGDGANNTILGLDGNDTIRGGAGSDALDGGAGSDFANYQGSSAAVNVNLLTNVNTGGDAAGDTLANIENLYGSSHDDTLTGDAGRNIIGGELGNDTLIGNGGDDSLSGEAGNDNLDGGDGNDRLVGGDGDDIANGGANSDSIDGGAGTDTLNGGAGDDSISGGAGTDTINGNDGNDIIEGGADADAIDGGAGIDTASYANSSQGVVVHLQAGIGLNGDADGDTLTGIEQVYGSAFNDSLTGDNGNNTFWGGAGNDTIQGAGGADVLKGGAGNDRFDYTSIGDSTVAASGKDTIVDFSTGDHIDLSSIDANGAGPGDTAFTFGTGGFTGAAGELRVVDFGGSRYGVYLDVNGDKQPDSIITVYSDHALTAADFVL